jgi:hypothetical protein
MAQKTNLNVSPYFDDFDSEKNFYKVLFNPGRPIQARELNNIQSILQNQIESFGSHIFKEGSVVIPGNLTYDSQFYAVKLNPTTFGVDISLYIDKFINKKITGDSSGITASIQKIEIPNNNNGLDYVTLYVKYISSDLNFNVNQFEDGESLVCNENVVYGNTTIVSGTPFASLIPTDATSIGSAASIANGIYFVRGTFARVTNETIILEYYTNKPSYRVGLKVSEEIVTSKEDDSLYDNARGFNNYSAPGADRFKINLSLTKKTIDSVDTDTDFIELLRIEEGEIKKIQTKTNYSIIKDYLAQRTFDESGNYSVEPFKISLHNSLNDRLGNNGLFFENQKTEENNTPSDDLMCIKLSPGKSYVKGYDIEKLTTTIIDVDKPRDTLSVDNVSVPFEMGNLFRVNNVSGSIKQNQIVELHSVRRSSSGNPLSTTKIGDARVYNYRLTDSTYTNNSTSWDLYLYDIQTYTTLVLNQSLSSSELPVSSFIKGKSSGASGFAVSSGNGTTTINLNQTSGTFIQGEQILINGLDTTPRTISSIVSYNIDDVKQIYQSTAVSEFTTSFLSDCILERFSVPGFNSSDTISINGGVVTSPGRFFSQIKIGSIIRFQKEGSSLETFNRVSSISSNGSEMTIESVADVSNVCDGTVGVVTSTTFSLGIPVIRNTEKAYLYSILPNSNVSSVNLNNSLLYFTLQSSTEKSPSGAANQISLSLSDFSLPTGLTTASFLPFDAERYSVHYKDGTIETLTSDKFSLSNNVVTLSNLTPGKITSVINASFVKSGIQSKIKQFNRSKTLNVIYSKNPQSGVGVNTSLNDGLIYNRFYGLRVQDERISLNYPDVVRFLAIYESLDSQNPTLDSLNFSILDNIQNNALIGENIIGNTSKTIARVVTKSTNSVGIVYLNSQRFISNEPVTFSESNISTTIDSIILGKYNDLTNNFSLDRGQKEQYYDYSSIVRSNGVSEPNRRLLIVFDYYSVPSDDNGDVFTVLSYDKERFLTDVPLLKNNALRSTDILDFRPRVTEFTSTSSSPFDFSSRNFDNSIRFNLSPDQNSLIGYNYYIGRIDKIYLDKSGDFKYLKGGSSSIQAPTIQTENVMELATISLPPYLYNTKDAIISLVDNKRYTMRDIGTIENRVENLERVTSLSLLELNTQTLQIQDAQGLNRFKTGFFVDDFKDSSRFDVTRSSVEVNVFQGELRPIISRNSLKNYLAPEVNTSNETIDLSQNYKLIDPNVQKTGESITLKYDSIPWISQLLATGVENVNPFNVVSYTGVIKLSPSSDTWVRTIELPNKNINVTNHVLISRTENADVRLPTDDRRPLVQPWPRIGPFWNRNGSPIGAPQNGGGGPVRFGPGESREVVNTTTNVRDEQSLNTVRSDQRNFLRSEIEEYMRSRNTEFSVSNLKPFTRFYQFLDGVSEIDFVPKLIEISTDSSLQNYGSVGSFQIGETVIGYENRDGISRELIKFRLASPNHKFGAFNSPSATYISNPYLKTESIPTAYSNSSKILNVDTYSLSQEAQGLYSGYITTGMKLVGETSGAIAYVKDRRLISDDYGDLIGSFFLRDPNTNPPPAIRINTGTKTYKITSSSTNQSGLSGDTSLSTAETNYSSTGTRELFETIITNTTTITTVRTTTVTTTRQTIITPIVRRDPLAQSFTVGGSNNLNNDENGAFITAVDLYFYTKDSGNAPLTVEIRTMDLGTPTLFCLGNPVVLRPDQIQTSEDGSVATTVIFDYPIYLEPNNEYAVVLLAPESDEYQVFIAEMGKKTIQTSNLPDSSSVIYSQQFALGSLFKSQNGSIWTASQYQDMKFRLYRAVFTTQPGVAYFYNPTLDRSNGYVENLLTNPITVLPKKLKLGITTVTDSEVISILTTGRKVGESSKTYNYGYIVGTGCSASSIDITTGGQGYTVDSSVFTYNIIGNGSGLTLNITSVSIGTSSITGVSIVNPGNGYSVGDVVGIVTSSVVSNSGKNAKITITGNNNAIDTLYLSNVQSSGFTNDGTSSLVYYNNSGARVSLSATTITSSTSFGEFSSGDYMRVNHFNHGMYAKNNKLKLTDVLSNISPTTLSQDLNSSSTSISIASTSDFGTFEGVPVSDTNPGYVLIDNEIIEYKNVSANTLEVISRGKDNTKVLTHTGGSTVFKYELNGVSLRRINAEHDIDDFGLGVDEYYIKIDRSTNGTNRSSDGTLTSYPQLSFFSELSCGGSNVYATENIQYDSLMPYYNILSPGAFTTVSGKIRTLSGTSVSGSESSFIDQGYEDIQLNTLNRLQSNRIICSKVNEDTYSTLDRKKSFITALTLNTTNKYLSPQIFIDDSFTEFHTNRINAPILNYEEDGRVNSILEDPHMAVYYSNTVFLAQPARSLKVIVSAYRHSSADFRVLYSLIRADSSEVKQTFELFPGYKNLTIDNNNDGFLDVIDSSKNSGLPDVYVPPSLENQFLDYEYNINNIGQFTGYSIKIVMSSTNQAYPPIFRDLRTIATL